MSSLVESLMNQFGGDAIEMLSKQLGAQPNQTNSALQSAIPVLVSALARNSSSQDGAGALFNALSKDHDGSILDQLTDFIPNASQGPGSGILGHVLGANRGKAESLISQISGIDQGSAGSLMETLAPVLMGMLGKEQRQQNLNQNGLAEMLQRAQIDTAENNPGVMNGILNQFLDQDGDGDIKDDLAGMAMKFLGGYFTK